MDCIEDCFVKFFLKQAEEIDPPTIQALIDHGYRTKLTLIAMDLNQDLPLIDEIPLAQRSLLRKYLGALQESQPFSVTLTNEPISSSTNSNYDYYQTVPIKKRKYDVYIADQNSSWIMNNNNDVIVSPKSPSSFSSNRSFSSGPSQTSTVKIDPQPEQNNNKRQSLKPARVSLSAHWPDEDEEKLVNPEENESLQIDDELKLVVKTSNRGRKPSSKVTPPRTPSQIRYDLMKKNMTNVDISMENGHNGNNDAVLNESMVKSDDPIRTPKRGRKPLKTTPRTQSQIRYEKMRQSMVNTTEDMDNNVPTTVTRRSSTIVDTPRPSTTSVKQQPEEKKVLTPAERAVLAKIEARKQAQTEVEKNKTRTSTPLRRKTRR